jgi:hypothetical protein
LRLPLAARAALRLAISFVFPRMRIVRSSREKLGLIVGICVKVVPIAKLAKNRRSTTVTVGRGCGMTRSPRDVLGRCEEP